MAPYQCHGTPPRISPPHTSPSHPLPVGSSGSRFHILPLPLPPQTSRLLRRQCEEEAHARPGGGVRAQRLNHMKQQEKESEKAPETEGLDLTLFCRRETKL
uniref:Uncharacterized protein n=1 Tax=Knipowitschia caucasica TaxID=637954 RepID=A0AAV2L8I5_KNICA